MTEARQTNDHSDNNH